MMQRLSRFGLLFGGFLGLFVIYLLQRKIQMFFYDLPVSRYTAFVLARSVRFIINDLLMIVIIYAIFQKRKYVMFAFVVQLFGVVLILMPYLYIKSLSSYNGPLVSFLHRLIVNPLLLLLLIPALYYKDKFSDDEKRSNKK